MEQNKVIFDTNIIIYLLKNETSVVDKVNYLFNYTTTIISEITLAEVLIGIEQSKKYSTQSLIESEFTLYPIEKEILLKAVELLSLKEKKSIRSPQFADMIIAATALNYKLPLFTDNPKDFNFITGLDLISL